jgi:hypothetical protein
MKNTILVTPICSLKPVQHLLHPEVLRYSTQIENTLRTYSGTLFPQEIQVEKLSEWPMMRAVRSYGIEDIMMRNRAKMLASTPYLLGLALQTSFLKNFGDIQTIEVLGHESLFIGRLGRSSQLCLRRGATGFSIMISTYIQGGLVNSTEREGASSVRILSFAPEVVHTENSRRLEDKMIG